MFWDILLWIYYTLYLLVNLGVYLVWHHPYLFIFLSFVYYSFHQLFIVGLNWGIKSKAKKGLKIWKPSTAPSNPDIVIIGASSAGLAVAACIKNKGITSFVILEKTNQIGNLWINERYNRLHLNTTRYMCNLPFVKWPSNYPIYPSKLEIAQYLRGYAEILGLTAHILFEHKVTNVDFSSGKPIVKVQTKEEEKKFNPLAVIGCVGEYAKPTIPRWPGDNEFENPIIPCDKYKEGTPFHNKKVLVVGFHNTGAEIAVDLWEQDAKPTVLCRSPVNILPRDIGNLFLLTDFVLPRDAKSSDMIIKAVNQFFYNDLKKFGITTPHPTVGLLTAASTTHDIGVIDTGAIDLIRRNEMTVITKGISHFTRDSVVFEDNREEKFDAVILATGYDKVGSVSKIFSEDVISKSLTSYGQIDSGKATGQKGLYFIGYNEFAGRFRETYLESFRVADLIQEFLATEKKEQ